MDFSFSETQNEIGELARKILTDRVTTVRLKEIEAGGEWFDRETWQELAKADVLGLAIPEANGGAGLGFMELLQVLEAQGRTVAPLPLLPTLVCAALPIAEFGTDAQKAAWLPGVAAGTTILTAALAEPANDDPTRPTTVAQPDGSGGWALTGTKISVEFAHCAARVLVTARTPSGDVLVGLLDPSGAGVSAVNEITTRREKTRTLTLSGAVIAAADVLGTPERGSEIARWIIDRALAGLCAIQLGVTETQLAMLAEYTSQREQFGRPIATFQAVAQRAADAYINVESVRLTTYQAVWRLAEGIPATEQVRIAKYFASDAAQLVAHAAQHCHGGVGMDVEYPLHRYTLWNKQIELTLGGGTQQLLALGAAMAS